MRRSVSRCLLSLSHDLQVKRVIRSESSLGWLNRELMLRDSSLTFCHQAEWNIVYVNTLLAHWKSFMSVLMNKCKCSLSNDSSTATTRKTTATDIFNVCTVLTTCSWKKTLQNIVLRTHLSSAKPLSLIGVDKTGHWILLQNRIWIRFEFLKLPRFVFLMQRKNKLWERPVGSNFLDIHFFFLFIWSQFQVWKELNQTVGEVSNRNTGSHWQSKTWRK